MSRQKECLKGGRDAHTSGGSSTKSHRPQVEKEGGWVMAIFEKTPSI